MKISGKKIILRQLKIDDLDIIHNKATDYTNISKYFTTFVRSKEYWLKRFEANGLWDENYGMLAICLKESEEIVALIYYFKHRYVIGLEISFTFLDQNIRGTRVNTEAIRIFTSYLFETYYIPRIQFNTLLQNVDTKKIKEYAKMIGFTYEGTMRKALYIRGDLVDVQLFSALREEYNFLLVQEMYRI